ncbi:MAG: hypothetical protein L3K10_04030 [Thermoplasmata archaeon]|nr:hypothetical protein [Thermoplasmata archaeon]
MEFVIVWASHPSWLTLQLPKDVAELIGYRPEEGSERDASRTISFLARGPRIARVVATRPAREVLAIETVRGRLIASARPGDRRIFTLPGALLDHLGVRVLQRGPRAHRGTDDGLVWFAPAPEFYEFRSLTAEGKPYSQPSNGPFGSVYVTNALYPFPRGLAELPEREKEIEENEWRPAVRMVQRVIGRGRRDGTS